MKLSEGLRKGLAIKEKIGRPYCASVIVAAGTSSRMGGTNKILTVLENEAVLVLSQDCPRPKPAVAVQDKWIGGVGRQGMVVSLKAEAVVLDAIAEG